MFKRCIIQPYTLLYQSKDYSIQAHSIHNVHVASSNTHIHVHTQCHMYIHRYMYIHVCTNTCSLISRLFHVFSLLKNMRVYTALHRYSNTGSYMYMYMYLEKLVRGSIINFEV